MKHKFLKHTSGDVRPLTARAEGMPSGRKYELRRSMTQVGDGKAYSFSLP